MKKDVCKDCDMLLPSNTIVCPVCGFDNSIDDKEKTDLTQEYLNTIFDETAPSYHPGY